MRPRRVVVVGAGIGGLVAALLLAARGVRVTVLERAAGPGGKMREVDIGGLRVDAGPTVLTMRWVFDEIFAETGRQLEQQLTLRPAQILARHAWSESERLDLFADPRRSADAIGEFAGPGEARGFLAFCERARRTYDALEHSFIRSARPSLTGLLRGAGWRGLSALWGIAPFRSLWSELERYFHDPRLQQLFGRYATYCGASPFSAPATLMLVAHVEREGVWLVEGGMHRIARALADAARACGAQFRYGADVCEIVHESGRVAGARLATGERVEADAVVLNADVAALASGWFGAAAATAVLPAPRAARSLSALTWAVAARPEGFPLLRHNVFFSKDYRAEFDDLCRLSQLPSAPTVYVCAQDRGDTDAIAPAGRERLLLLVNAPADGDRSRANPEEIQQCERQTIRRLEHCGLKIRRTEPAVLTTPTDFERMFPATGGALYGPALHGWRAAFRRQGARSRLPGLYLAGGSTHPGPGVPMAALSGRSAAACVLADLVSTSPLRHMATHGGTSTH
jgi:1-hydroxycarotenoid 3,4-desaturase